MHSILVLFQANTLNVAFNSHNKSLLTIMMSNNVSTLSSVQSAQSLVDPGSTKVNLQYSPQVVIVNGSVVQRLS